MISSQKNNIADASPPPLMSPPPKKVTYELAAHNIYYAKPAVVPRSLVAQLLKPCGTAPTPPDYILRDLSLTAQVGEILAVVGPRGASKSTLLDILATRTTPTQGMLLFNATPLRSASSFRMMSAHVPQADVVLDLLTVSETFAFAASLLHPESMSDPFFFLQIPHPNLTGFSLWRPGLLRL